MSQPRTPEAELSPRAIAIGLGLAIVMGIANLYFGLRVGMTVSASLPASVVGMVLLRTFFKDGSILEANQIQTAASTGESLAAGVIFTLPAFVIAGLWDDFDPWATTLIAISGGLLGVLLMIPLRKMFIEERTDLPFPEAQACAQVLRAGDKRTSKHNARSVIRGALTGGASYGLLRIVMRDNPVLEAATRIGKSVVYLGADLSPALIGIGFIVRLRVAFLVFLGGALAWWVALPLASLQHDIANEQSVVDYAWAVWKSDVRYLGVGMMLVGGLTTVRDVLPQLRQAFARVSTHDPHSAHHDMNPKARLLLMTAVLLTLLFLWTKLTHSFWAASVSLVVMVPLAFLFCAMAAYIVGLIGNSNSPVSGMTLCAMLITALLLRVLGFKATQGMLATLSVAAVVCCAICLAGDLCNDLKTGFIVGASARKQQQMQILSAIAAALTVAPLMQLLHELVPGGIGGRELAAPQAVLFASLVSGVFGDTDLPLWWIGSGCGVGALVYAGDHWLQKNKREMRLPVMPIAIGLYLPFKLAVTMLLGGLWAYRLAKKHNDKSTLFERRTLFASGLIAGESLMGVALILFSALPFDSELSTLLVASTILALALQLRRHKN